MGSAFLYPVKWYGTGSSADKKCKSFNSYLKNFIPADVSVKDGKFYYIDRKKENVKGIRGILEMISATKDAPIDIFFGIPSSVPSTNEKLETTGGIIDCSAMKHLLEEKDVICVGDSRQVINCKSVIWYRIAKQMESFLSA